MSDTVSPALGPALIPEPAGLHDQHDPTAPAMRSEQVMSKSPCLIFLPAGIFGDFFIFFQEAFLKHERWTFPWELHAGGSEGVHPSSTSGGGRLPMSSAVRQRHTEP